MSVEIIKSNEREIECIEVQLIAGKSGESTGVVREKCQERPTLHKEISLIFASLKCTLYRSQSISGQSKLPGNRAQMPNLPYRFLVTNNTSVKIKHYTPWRQPEARLDQSARYNVSLCCRATFMNIDRADQLLQPYLFQL